MAGKLRYWKEKDGRFWARIAVPARLRPFLDQPRSELLEPLGGDRRLALRLHPAAVARLRQEIALAEQKANTDTPVTLKPAPQGTPLTIADFRRAASSHYSRRLDTDDQRRAAMPTPTEINAEYERIMALLHKSHEGFIL